jgi:transposase-like protein
MSVVDKNQPPGPSSSSGKKKRRLLSAEKKFQIFLEAQRGETQLGELLRREGLYSSDLARIQRKVKEGALQRLADRPGRSRPTISHDDYDALKRELEEKERVMAEMAVELAVLRKKTNGGSWER